MASNHKRGQGSSWAVKPAEEEEEEEEEDITYNNKTKMFLLKKNCNIILFLRQFSKYGRFFS
jgi:hypothetical protein